MASARSSSCAHASILQYLKVECLVNTAHRILGIGYTEKSHATWSKNSFRTTCVRYYTNIKTSTGCYVSVQQHFPNAVL